MHFCVFIFPDFLIIGHSDILRSDPHQSIGFRNHILYQPIVSNLTGCLIVIHIIIQIRLCYQCVIVRVAVFRIIDHPTSRRHSPYYCRQDKTFTQAGIFQAIISFVKTDRCNYGKRRKDKQRMPPTVVNIGTTQSYIQRRKQKSK